MSNVEQERAKRMAGAVASGLAVVVKEGPGGIVRMGEVMGMVRPEQEQALEMLVGGKTVTETAREVRLSRTTVYTWLNEDAVFAAAFNQWRMEKKKSMKLRMMKMAEKAAGAVEKSLEGGDGRLGLRMLEKMGMVEDEEIGATDAGEVEEQRKIEKKEKELAVRKAKAAIEAQEEELELGLGAFGKKIE